jgi:hypothetical protein
MHDALHNSKSQELLHCTNDRPARLAFGFWRRKCNWPPHEATGALAGIKGEGNVELLAPIGASHLYDVREVLCRGRSS